MCASPRSKATSSSASAPSRPRTGTQRLALVVATVGGVGYVPIAPGTAASGLTVLVLSLVPVAPAVLALFVVLITVAGMWAAQQAERLLGAKDPGAIVIDEVAGMVLSVLALPLTPAVLVTGFFLFRLFDIVKPFPANALQRLSGGVGVMIDDLVAGLYAGLVLVAAHVVVGWP